MGDPLMRVVYNINIDIISDIDNELYHGMFQNIKTCMGKTCMNTLKIYCYYAVKNFILVIVYIQNYSHYAVIGMKSGICHCHHWVSLVTTGCLCYLQTPAYGSLTL
ncbi:hypothetical protein PanWU01x14_210270, partial [Parasponia andersonii]